MPPIRVHSIVRLALIPVCLAASGCFIPGGGWTMRTGVDLRRRWKPSAFIELVDTKWDEYNRVEELNMSGVFDEQGAVFIPGSPPVETAPIPSPPSPATSVSPARTAYPGSASQGREPYSLPGATDDSHDGVQTVERSPVDGVQMLDAPSAVPEGAAPPAKPVRIPVASRLFARP